jgi:glyoxylase-like metal-dependent hydrolase (beta-lactamase superfamily II)
VIDIAQYAPDHLAFYDRSERWMFTGDLILQHISSNAIVEPNQQFNRMPTLRMQQESLLKIRSLGAEVFYPGHGPFIQNPIQTINFRLDRTAQKLERILGAFEGEERTAFELAKKVYPVEHKQQFSLVMSEIIGHLDLLEDECKIKKNLEKGILYYSV